MQLGDLCGEIQSNRRRERESVAISPSLGGCRSDGTTAPLCSGSNGTDVSIPDSGPAVTSTITISNCDRNASNASEVEVNINHTYRGDLQIDLVAPDGTSYRLKNADNDSAENVNTTYAGNVSSEAANGAWHLRVQDVAARDTGKIDSWTLKL
jgi:subtilisin-like proprotein convertase family protein